MTIEEAIEKLSNRYMVVSECIDANSAIKENIALDMAISALEAQDKYRWHDLRKDPNDLPNDDSIEYVVYVEYRNGKRECTVGCLDMSGDMMLLPTLGNWIGNSYHIIAWREIEPFDEVE